MQLGFPLARKYNSGWWHLDIKHDSLTQGDIEVSFAVIFGQC
jgi:hypothetical protein